MKLPTCASPVCAAYVEKVKASWTWALLTPEERDECIRCLSGLYLTGDTDLDEANLSAVYHAFLCGAGYMARDKEKRGEA